MASVEASVYDVKACVDCFDKAYDQYSRSCFPFHVFFKTPGETERVPVALAIVSEGFQPGDELLLGEPGTTCSRRCLD